MVKLPQHVEKLLRVGRRRTNRLRRGRAIAVVGALALAVLALAMAVDATVTIFDDVVRWALTLAVYLTAAGGALAAAVRLVRGRPTFPQLARQVDAAHPELQERLATLVDVATREAAGEETGASDDLLQLLAREAEAEVSTYNYRREFPLGSLFAWMLPLLALVLLFAGAGLARPKLTKCLAQRVLTPWVDTGNLYADELEVAPGDLTVLAGTNLVITAKAKSDFGGQFTIRISRWTGEGWDRERATPMADGVFETAADLSDPRWRYRVNCGPAVSRYHEVRVVPRPAYASFSARIDWPDYTGRAPTVVSNAEVAVVRSVLGSRVTFRIEGKDETQPKFELADATAARPATNVWTWSRACSDTNTVAWTLAMVASEGFVEPVGKGFVETGMDRPPAVAIQAPQEQELALPRRGRLPLLYTANDDFGIAAAELHVRISGTTNEIACLDLQPEAMEGMGRRLATTLDLETLPLQNVGKIVVTAVVRDACPPAFGGYHAATSTPVRVRIDDGAKDYRHQALEEMAKQARDLYNEARHELDQAYNKANELRNDVRNAHGEYKEHSERKLEEISKLFEEALEKLKTLDRAMEEDDRLDPIAEAFRQMLEEQMAAAAAKLQQAQPETEHASERAQAANEMPEAMRQALEAMRPIEPQMNDRFEDVMTLERTQDLAERQESLAQQAEERAERLAEQQQAEAAAARQQAATDQPAANAERQQAAQQQKAADEAADRAQQEEWRRAEENLGWTANEMRWRTESPDIEEAARQMHAAVRRAYEEERGRIDERARAAAMDKAQEKLQKAREALQQAQKKREEAAQVDAAHAVREAEATQKAQAEADRQYAEEHPQAQPESQPGGEPEGHPQAQPENPPGGEPEGRPQGQPENPPAGAPKVDPVRLPYTDGERDNLNRLHREARDLEKRAVNLERDAADELMQAEASEATRQAMGEAIEALHAESEPAEAARRAFERVQWNHDALAPEGQNAEFAQALAKADAEAAEAQQALEQEKAARAAAKADAQQQQGQQEQGPQEQQQGQNGEPQAPADPAAPPTSAQAARAAAERLKQAVAEQREALGMPQQAAAETKPNQAQPGQPGQQSVQLQQRMLMRSRMLVPPQLRGELSQEEWIRLRAVLGEAESVDLAQVPEEYRELVKRYFHVLAGDGAKKK